MEQTDRANPREDDQRAKEDAAFTTGAPVEERDDRHRQQGAGDQEPDLEPGHRPITAEPDATGTSIDDRMLRSDFARWITPSELPATAATLARSTEDAGAPDWVVEGLAALPEDRELATIGEAWHAVTGTG